MNGNSDWYKLYITDAQRKMLHLDYTHKQVYLFILNHRLYISTNAIPATQPYKELKARIAYTSWYIPIPARLLPETNRTLARYSIQPTSKDKQTCQIIPISPRIFLKEPSKYGKNIKKLSKTRRREIENLKTFRNTEPTTHRQDPDIFDTLQ